METSAVSTAVPATEVKQAESYGQQIAPHFPEANTSAQLNQQAQNQVTQSVAPTQAVPIDAPTYTREDLSKSCHVFNGQRDAGTAAAADPEFRGILSCGTTSRTVRKLCNGDSGNGGSDLIWHMKRETMLC